MDKADWHPEYLNAYQDSIHKEGNLIKTTPIRRKVMKILSNCPEYKECPAYELCFEETTSCEIRSNYIRLKTVKAVFDKLSKFGVRDFNGEFHGYQLTPAEFEALKSKYLEGK